MKRPIYLTALTLASLATAQAVTPVSFTGTNYTQNFDSLASSGSNLTSPVTSGPADVPATTFASPLAGWSFLNYLGTGTTSIFAVGNGSTNSGAVFSYGTTESADRALGSLASGSTVSEFGLTLVNNTSSIYTSFTLTYTGEQWRYGGAITPATSTVVNTLGFSYSFGATDINTGTFNAVPELSFSSMINTTATPTTAEALNGNLAANQTAVTYTISGLLWNPGSTLTLRWADVNDAGNDNGLAIDDLTFSAIATPVNTLVWNTTGGTWNTTSANWTGGTGVFSNGDIVQFTDAHVGVVNIDAGGVAPAKIEVSNTAGTYTFQGGAITGSAEFLKTGAGTVVLTSQAQNTGGFNIQGGTLKTGASDVLADVASVTIGSGAVLDLQNNTDTIGSLILNGGTANSGANGILTVNGTIGVQANAQTAFIKGNLITSAGTHVVTVADGASAIDLQIDAALAGGRLQFAGTGTSSLTADNSSFTGGVTLNTGGNLSLGNKGALGTGSFFFNGGKLSSTVALVGANAIATPISVGGDITIDATNPMEFTSVSTTFGSATKVITVMGQATISGVIANSSATPPVAGVLNKGGAGTLTLTAINTYTGATTVQAGALVISSTGAIANSVSLGISNGATLTLQNNVSLNDTINLSLVTGSILSLNFTGEEKIGSFAINGTFLAVDNYTLAELQALSGGAVFNGNSGASLTVTAAVPEPGTVALIAVGMGVILLGARRRRAA